MRALVLLALVACRDAPRSDHGTLLYADADEWVVQHDDPLARTVQGVEVYAAPESSSATPGDHLDLWIDRDPLGAGAIRRFVVTGADPLPANHVTGGSPLTGTVVRADETKLLIDHDAIPDVMPAMVMPFVAGRPTAARLGPGDRITGRIVGSRYGYAIVDVDTIGSVDVSGAPVGEPTAPGAVLPRIELDGHDGRAVVVGADQGAPTVLAFIYTTCPDPTFCPATVAKLQAVHDALPEGARIVAVTIDPAVDTVPLLAAYAELVGASPPSWIFARPAPAELHTLAIAAGLTVSHRSGRIAHSTRVLVSDADGRLVLRLDDNEFSTADVIGAL